MGIRSPLEPHTRTKIDRRLDNLGWILDQNNPECNVFQEQAKTDEQNAKFEGKNPDYVLYESGTDNPIAIVEAKRPGEDLDKALDEAVKKYARPLQTPLVFAFSDTFVASQHVYQSRPLKIDGEELQEFVDQLTSLRFVNEGAEILSAPKGINFNRDELLRIFKRVNNSLRKEGLRDGYERFSAFAEILFIKLIDEFYKLDGGGNQFPERFLWSKFFPKFESDPQALLDFVSGSVWQQMKQVYGDIFGDSFSIKKPNTLKSIFKDIHPINLTATDTDVKGDAFEYFLKTVTNGNKDLGEYFTPRHIVRTMVNIVKPKHGETVYDPFCGTGGFLLECFKYLTLRTDPGNQAMMRWIRNEALHGRELTSTARITKMNMILFGDGHTNIQQIDSLENPVDSKYDIVLSNIPYSQKTEYGSYYSIPTDNADSLCVQHIWRSLKPNGRAAVIVPETFLYEDGVIGSTREMIVKHSRKFTVISLPRGVFMPYTPTKTNILFFEKGGQFNRSFFFVVHNDGFELNTKRKPVRGESDIKKLLSDFDSPKIIEAKANIVERKTIEDSGNWNLRPYFYMDDVPNVEMEMETLSSQIIQCMDDKVDPQEQPDDIWKLLEVSQNGIFLKCMMPGSEFNQQYKVVRKGDIAYNPHRVNIGSIGVVPAYLDGGLVSPAYVVFRVIDKKYPPSYIVSVLKQPRYLKVIMNYSLASARASLPFEELTRIKIPKPNAAALKNLAALEKEYNEYSLLRDQKKNDINNFSRDYLNNA